jgi:hypothetical protein
MSYNLQSHKPAPGCINDTYKRAAQLTLSSEIVRHTLSSHMNLFSHLKLSHFLQQLLRLEVADDTTVRHTYEASP